MTDHPTIGATEIEDLAVGAWILGTGGGGSPYLNLLNLRRLTAAGHRFRLVDPASLDDDAHVAVVSTMGAPIALAERLQDSRDVARAVEVMAAHVGRPFDALMATEIGGSNGLQPFMAAAHLDLPVVDADAMGRAFPQAQMTSFAVGGLQPWPLALVDPRGVEAIVTQVPSWSWMERASRVLCVEVGSLAATCKAPRTGAEVKAWGITGTVRAALRLGEVVREARAAHTDPIAAVVAATDGVELFRGKVIDVDRRTTGGFLRGIAAVEGLDAWRGSRLVVDFQNEWSVARVDDEVVVTVPHLIALLDGASGEAVGTETIRYGQRVAAIAMRSPEVFLSPAGLAATGPRAFGHDLDVVAPIGTAWS